MLNRKGKYIISASRRTDMLASDPNRLYSLLSGKRSINNIKLAPENIHTLLISTKDYRNIIDIPRLRDVGMRCDQVCFNLTITGFGGTPLEPKVPKANILLKRLPDLIKYAKDPNRITWCYDPILRWNRYDNVSLEKFYGLAQEMRKTGVARVIAMFYKDYGNSKIQPDNIADNFKQKFAMDVSGVCSELNMDLTFCGMKGMHRHKCVDLELYGSLHPTKEHISGLHYKKIKKPDAGYCRDAIWDIGWYHPKCKHRCLYCYCLKGE